MVTSRSTASLDSVGQLISPNDTHITSTHYYSQNSAPQTARSDGFLWTTTSSCRCNARSSSSSSTCCCNTRCCCNTHPLLSKDNASTSRDNLAAASHATAAAAVLIPGSTSTHMKVNVAATFCQKMSPVWAYFTKLHRRFCPRDEPGQERHAACVAETARSVVCTPTTVRRRCSDIYTRQGTI